MIYDFNTSNESAIKVAKQLKDLGVRKLLYSPNIV